MMLRNVMMSAAFGLAVLSTAIPPAAADQDYRDGRHAHGERFNRNWHGDIRHFGARDLHRWRGGHWVHGRHDGFLGWWWVVAGIWYFYPAPVHPYPDPYIPPAAVPPPSPPPSASRYWYYCEAAQSYYPYIATCPGGWKKIPATPPDAPQP